MPNGIVTRLPVILDDSLHLSNPDEQGQTILKSKKTGNEYGIVYEKNIAMCQAIDGARITYDETSMKSIERISEDAENGQLVFTMTDGEERRYGANRNYDDQYHIIDDEQTTIGNYLNNGSLISTLHFFKQAFPNWKDYLYWDVLADRAAIDMQIIGGEGIALVSGGNDIVSIWEAFEKRTITLDENGNIHHVKTSKMMVYDVINNLASKNPKNTFLEHINKISEACGSLPLDTKHFLSSIGMQAPGLNDEDEELYLQMVSRAIFLAVIERQMLKKNDEPRSFRFVPVIYGGQGNCKSELCKRLAMFKWHRESTESIEYKKNFNESIEGAAIVEFVEAVQFKHSDPESIKAFLDATKLQYRKSYEKDSSTRLIRFLIMITSNQNEISKDLTGNTRFFPIYNPIEQADNNPVYELDDETMCRYWAFAIKQYEYGERWDDGFYDKRFLKIAHKVQSSIVQMPLGLEEVKQFLDDEYSNIGDKAYTAVIRKHLKDKMYTLSDKDLESIMKNVSKSIERFGFKKTRNSDQIKIDGIPMSSKYYVRVEPPDEY